MEQENHPPPPTTKAKVESKCRSSVSLMTTPPSRLRTFSRAKDSLKPDIVNSGVKVSSPSTIKARAKSVPRDIYGGKNQNTIKRSLVCNEPKSGVDVVPLVVGPQKGRDLEQVKAVVGRLPVVSQQFARPSRQRPASGPSSLNRRNEEKEHLDGKKNEFNKSETLIKNLQAEVLELKAELENAHCLNVELQSLNRRLSEDLASAKAKIAAFTIHDQTELVSEYQSPKFKDIQKLIANKLEHPKFRQEAVNETSTTKTPSHAAVLPISTTDVQRKVPELPSALPPPPPPPPLPLRPARAATSGKASAVVELYGSLAKQVGNNDHPLSGNCNRPIVSSAHYSIVGEIQNRSAHLLAIKSDIETKGEFINSLIQKVLAAAHTDIEDLLKFVGWLDSELSSLADEGAVLKHFKWPEKKADAMREAAIEYHGLRLLESEVSSYKDNPSIPCEVSLKKMAGLHDKSERSIQKFVKLRNSVMLSYQGHKIPTDWMLDSGIISKIKLASISIANMYMKRVTAELESIRNSEKEFTQETLLLQGVHFAYKAHQFSGELDSETLCAFEEIRQHVRGHLRARMSRIAD